MGDDKKHTTNTERRASSIANDTDAADMFQCVLCRTPRVVYNCCIAKHPLELS
jgi:hypothetical protein